MGPGGAEKSILVFNSQILKMSMFTFVYIYFFLVLKQTPNIPLKTVPISLEAPNKVLQVIH